MSTETLDQVSVDPLTGESRAAHLIPPKDGKAGHVRAMEARLEGTPIEALCGLVLVPSRDPKNLPSCARCLVVFQETTGQSDGWKDA